MMLSDAKTTVGTMKVPEAKPVPLPLCPLYIPHGIAWHQTWTSMLRDQQLTTWDTWQGFRIKN